MPVSSSKNFLERIIPEVGSSGGRNIVEIARKLHLPVETTRYRVKAMMKRGLRIYASFDYNKFDLTCYFVYLRLTEKALRSEKKLFQVLAETSFLISYSRKLPTNEFICSFAVPEVRSSSSAMLRLVRALTEEGVVASSRVCKFSWRKSHMIQPEYFHLKKGVWRVDWEELRKEASRSSEKSVPLETSHAEYDELDLHIARALEMDGLERLSSIAKKLKTTLNNVFYHFHKHIVEGKLIDEFVIGWFGSQKQETLLTHIEFRNLSRAEETKARSVIRKLPFLLTDAGSFDTGQYFGQAILPSSEYLGMLNYLSATLGETSNKLRVAMSDARNVQRFSLPAHLFKNDSWKFDPETAASHAASAIRK
jgi:DNA-binding Lrp family transcriptional regulator